MVKYVNESLLEYKLWEEKDCIDFYASFIPYARAAAQWIVAEWIMGSRSKFFFKVTIDMTSFPWNNIVRLTNQNGHWVVRGTCVHNWR